MRIPSKEDRAWAAGFIEGEGCFSPATNQNGVAFFRVEACQKDMEPLEKLKSIFGTGYINHKSGGGVASWRVCNIQEAQTIIGILWPYLSQRRKDQIKEASKKVRAGRNKIHPYQVRARALEKYPQKDI